MLRRLIKLQLKVALLPLRVARSVVKLALDELGPTQLGRPQPAAGYRSSSLPPESEPAPSQTMQVEASEVIRRIEEGEAFVFVDVRQAGELTATGAIQGSVHIPTQDLPRRMDELDPTSQIVAYCAAGMRSLDAAVYLREKGFDGAWSLGGGLPSWFEAGGSVIQA